MKTIPGIGEFFVRLIDAEIDDISRFRSPKKLTAYAGLAPSTYSSGGKTFHGRIVKQGNKWLRGAFVEAVAPSIATNPQLRVQYEHLKSRGTNKARVAIARKLLTIAFPVLRDQRAYERRDVSSQGGAASTISRLSDGWLAGPATPDRALEGEWEAGSRTPLCDRSRNDNGHQGHGLENGWRPVGTRPPRERERVSRSVDMPVETQPNPRKSARQNAITPLSSFIGELP